MCARVCTLSRTLHTTRRRGSSRDHGIKHIKKPQTAKPAQENVWMEQRVEMALGDLVISQRIRDEERGCMFMFISAGWLHWYLFKLLCCRTAFLRCITVEQKPLQRKEFPEDIVQEGCLAVLPFSSESGSISVFRLAALYFSLISLTHLIQLSV